jgi:outer membrane protein TolC
VDRLRKLHDDIKTGVVLGLNRSGEIPAVEDRLVKAKMELFRAEAELKASRLAFSVLLNRPGDDNFVLDRKEFTPDIMKAMVDKYDDYTGYSKRQKKLEQFLVFAAIKNSAEYKITDENIGIQQSLIESNRYRFLPEFALQGRYSYGHEFLPRVGHDNDYWTIGGALKFPLSFGRSKSRELKAGLEELLYRKDHIRLEQVQQVIGSLNDFTLLLTTLPMNYYSRGLSQASLDSAAALFDKKDISIYQLIEQENNYSAAAMATISERFRFFYTYVDMLGKVGVGYLIHGTEEETKFYRELEEFMGK